MIPGTGRNFLSEFFGVYYGADELSADFPSILKLSPVDHLKTSDTDASSCGGDFELPEFFPPWVSSNSGQGMELIDNKPKVDGFVKSQKMANFQVLRSIISIGYELTL